MFDLDAINNRKIDVKLNDEIINVNEATYGIAKKVNSFQKYLLEEGSTEEEASKMQAELILDFLNNNENNKKFAQKDLDRFSYLGIKAIYNLLIDSINKTNIDPNLESPCQEEK